MIKELLIATGLLVTSMASQASIIEYRGYSREVSSNIVTGNGVEWLKWDVNKGKSIKESLDEYADAGWMLATDTQITSLFNIFQFGKMDWTIAENTYIEHRFPRSEGIMTPHEEFLQLFGFTQFTSCVTLSIDCSVWSTDPLSLSNVLYSAAENAAKPYRNALVSSPYTGVSGGTITFKDGGWAALIEHIHTNPYVSFTDQSVALVRPTMNNPVSVSLPATVSLLALGLVALVFRRRQTIYC
jgi:hypothetical protein